MTDDTKARELLLEAINANIKAANDANAPLFARLAQLDALTAPTIPTMCAKCFRVVAPGIECPVCHTQPIPPRWAFEQVEREYAIYRRCEPNPLNIDVVMSNPTGWVMHHAWANYIACIEAKGGS
jgi:hypothetical protein